MAALLAALLSTVALSSGVAWADGADPTPSTPEEYAANIAREEGMWAALAQKLGLKFE